MQSRVKAMFSVTVLALLALVSLSHAADYKIYPGAACQPRSGTEASSFTTDKTAIINFGTQSSFVTCPLVRDRIRDPDELDPGMRVASANGRRLICTFYSMNQDGVELGRVERDTTSSNATSLIFSGSPIRTEAIGYYTFECFLPPNGRVILYSLGEAGETGVD